MGRDEERRDLTRLVEALAEQGGAIARRTRHTLTEADVLEAIATTLQAGGVEFVRRYNRLEIEAHEPPEDGPLLFVANHGFGGIFDLNVFALIAALTDMGLERPVTFLVHEIAWTLRVGALIEPLGARPASHDAAREAVERGEHVVVLPGGDVDGGKSFRHRNTIMFAGRTGFARLATELGTPIVPVVTAGAGETLFVLSSGRRLARLLRLDRLLRVKAVPISVSLPWGVSIGAVGLLPYFPLPSKLRTRVLAPVDPRDAATVEDLADDVVAAMQATLDELSALPSWR
ncbi:MAG: 1-acyl-sn-glycerol-3-phosphate acyltransferase [Gordonia paraffinivorans]